MPIYEVYPSVNVKPNYCQSNNIEPHYIEPHYVPNYRQLDSIKPTTHNNVKPNYRQSENPTTTIYHINIKLHIIMPNYR